MPTPKIIGTETEYNIYSNTDSPSADEAVNLMINVLKGERLGLDKRAATPTRCFLANGGLLYKDVGAPEYCTPECPNPRDLVVFDKAGELIVRELARKVSVLANCKIDIYKKSSDGLGNTSGCHENYSVSPSLFRTLTSGHPDEPAITVWTTFLAIRQALIGGGKVGSEFDGMPCPFQMSQRADFIVAFRNNQTLADRPVIQTRDEALADGNLVRRLHVICGDANLCEPAILMKGGLTSLMLMALEDDFSRDRPLPVFVRKVPQIFRAISRDVNLERKYGVSVVGPGERTHRQLTVLEILGQYLSALNDYLGEISSRFGSDEDSHAYDLTMETAFSAFSDLMDRNYNALFGICDWATKLVLAERFRGRGQISEEDLKSYIDMGYANTDQNSSVYAGLVRKGLAKRVVSDEEIQKALTVPPSHGRAPQRVVIMQKFADNIKYVDWGKITLAQSNQDFGIEFDTPFGYNERVFNDILESSGTPEEFFRAWKTLAE